MSKEAELWHFLAERLEADGRAALLIVADSRGSSPGRPGYKLAVAADDQILGSIGGGAMEVKLVDETRTHLRDVANPPFAELIKQEHRENSEHPSGMICSGEQTVIRLILTRQHRTALNAAVDAFAGREYSWLTVSASGIEVPSEQTESISSPLSFQTDGEVFTYTEKLGPKNELFIIGGGHCALELSRLVSRLDFHVHVYDDRPHLNTIEKNRFADSVTILDSYDLIASHVPSGDNAYVVVMTLGYRTDEIVVRKLLGHRFKYLGVLGSKGKMATLLRNLRNEGILEELLEAIHTPIGIPINSQTPEEIAVSIAAELISVKNS